MPRQTTSPKSIIPISNSPRRVMVNNIDIGATINVSGPEPTTLNRNTLPHVTPAFIQAVLNDTNPN